MGIKVVVAKEYDVKGCGEGKCPHYSGHPVTPECSHPDTRREEKKLDNPYWGYTVVCSPLAQQGFPKLCPLVAQGKEVAP